MIIIFGVIIVIILIIGVPTWLYARQPREFTEKDTKEYYEKYSAWIPIIGLVSGVIVLLGNQAITFNQIVWSAIICVAFAFYYYFYLRTSKRIQIQSKSLKYLLFTSFFLLAFEIVLYVIRSR